MDNKFTELMKHWLESPAEERDYAVGALYLLRLTGNQIMYRNLVANPKAKAEFIEYQLQKYYNFRVQNLTHEQVEVMQQQVDEIVQNDIPLAAQADEHKRGKRDDHECLTTSRLNMWRISLSCSGCVRCTCSCARSRWLPRHALTRNVIRS